MSKTSIEWTNTTWNPTRGCSRISPGCKNCYAEKIAGRFSTHALQTGDEDAGIFAGFAIMKNHEAHWTGKLDLIESKLLEPLHWRKPRRVFVNSMSDLFHENLREGQILHVFDIMERCPQHTFQILTKRAEWMRDWMEWYGKVLPNVHLGVSIENQETADQRIPKLLQTPAVLRFISYEPALERVDLDPYLYPKELGGVNNWAWLDWVIIGGESGPDARPFDLEWARTTIRQCKAAGVPVFLKQLGSNPVQTSPECLQTRYPTKNRKGGDVSEWPKDLRKGTREFPKAA